MKMGRISKKFGKNKLKKILKISNSSMTLFFLKQFNNFKAKNIF